MGDPPTILLHENFAAPTEVRVAPEAPQPIDPNRVQGRDRLHSEATHLLGSIPPPQTEVGTALT